MDLLKFPPEIMELLLHYFFDCTMIGKFWQAICSCHKHRIALWPLVNSVVGKRSGSYCRDGVQVRYTELGDHASVLVQSRLLSERLIILDYCEQIPDVLWCGHVEFKDPLLPYWSIQKATVVLESQECWKIEHLNSWDSNFHDETIQLVSQAYNFVPIRPRGRMYGLTKSDRQVIQNIRQRIEQRDQVFTLRFRNKNSSSSIRSQKNLILRVISPEQADRRLSAPLMSTRTGLAWKYTFESFEEGLLCCWESSEDDEEVTLTRETTICAMQNTLSSYRKHKYMSNT